MGSGGVRGLGQNPIQSRIGAFLPYKMTFAGNNFNDFTKNFASFKQ